MRTRSLCLRLAPLTVLLGLWLWFIGVSGAVTNGPNGRAFGSDFAMYLAGAHVLADNGNPFDRYVLYRRESALLHRQGLPITKTRGLVRVGEPPLFFWALEPLATLPFQLVASLWSGCLCAICSVGLIAALRSLGWRRWLWPTAIFLAMPQVILACLYGNLVAVVFSGICCSLALAKRHPVAAGALLSVSVLKPQIGLPAVLLLALFYTPARWRLIAGFTGSVIVLMTVGLAMTGWHSLVLYANALVGYSDDMAMQPNIASLAGLYVGWAPTPVRLVVGAVILVIACTLTGLAVSTLRTRQRLGSGAPAWLWVVWFLATPYAHFLDEMILALPVIMLLGRNAHRISRARSLGVLYFLFFSVLLYSWTPFHLQLLPLPLLAVAWWIGSTGHRRLLRHWSAAPSRGARWSYGG